MPCPDKKRGKHRKHTEITSEKQRGLFGAEYARRKAGEEPRMPGITRAELKSHLEETKGKKLRSASEGSFLSSRKAKFGVK